MKKNCRFCLRTFISCYPPNHAGYWSTGNWLAGASSKSGFRGWQCLYFSCHFQFYCTSQKIQGHAQIIWSPCSQNSQSWHDFLTLIYMRIQIFFCWNRAFFNGWKWKRKQKFQSYEYFSVYFVRMYVFACHSYINLDN